MRYPSLRGDFYKLDFQIENFLLVHPSLIFVMIVVRQMKTQSDDDIQIENQSDIN
jgi:hypothetical protein